MWMIQDPVKIHELYVTIVQSTFKETPQKQDRTHLLSLLKNFMVPFRLRLIFYELHRRQKLSSIPLIQLFHLNSETKKIIKYSLSRYVYQPFTSGLTPFSLPLPLDLSTLRISSLSFLR